MSDAKPDSRQFEYKAEVKKLLDILVHSVYSSKDVFIRELISNAADALEKVRFAEVQGEDIVADDRELGIQIECIDEEDDKRLIFTDNGIGMSEEEVINNLGTIAHSGASSFLEAMKNKGAEDDPQLIGQFGIGFYSVFMVANKVTITTQSAHSGVPAVQWESDGIGSYSLSTPEGDVPRGTRIEVHLKSDDESFAQSHTVENAIRTYSNFVPFPVKVGDEVKNNTKALWREQPSQVSDEDYTEFFKFLTYESDEPFERLHFSTDVPLQFSALLYVPKSSPELQGFGEGEVSLQLYVKRVLIDGANPNLLPKWLRFAKGVVESQDLPLNISRETLQENRVITKIRDLLTKKLLGQFEKLANKDPERYLEFWETYGRILKEGYMDFQYKDRLQDLLRFASSTDGKVISLSTYVDRKPEAQKAIYYLSGPSKAALDRDPRLEIFRRKDIEVLYLYDMADEIVLGGLGLYKELPLVSADQVKLEDLEELGESNSEKKGDERPTADLEKLTERFKTVLGDKVEGVRTSERLVDSPACLVHPEGGSAHMDRMMRMMNKDNSIPKRVLELNPKHVLIRQLVTLIDGDNEEEFVNESCEQLFEAALLLDGLLEDPHRLVEGLHRSMTQAAEARS